MTLKEEICGKAQEIQNLSTERPVNSDEIFRLATEIKQLCAENIGIVGNTHAKDSQSDSSGTTPSVS